MKPNLSIIIPCFNCAQTLEEAVASCFRQGLSSFEIVMVDDASTDDTREVMKSLAGKHPEIKLVFHEMNKGGGAARNTAVENSSADVIFCLDSDDMLADGTLAKMFALQQEKQCDGVGINVSRKFSGTDPEAIVSIDRFGYAGERVPLESLFQKNGLLCPLYSTFMFTKRAFAVAGGYPTAHGFDTQGFAWRFLGNGLIAYGCPEATYLHRVNFTESYYIREYNSGRVNGNWRMVLEEFLFLLSPEAQSIVINAHKLPFGTNLMDEVGNVSKPLSEMAPEYAQEGAREKVARAVRAERGSGARHLASQYWLGCFLMDSGELDEARKTFLDLAKEPNFKRQSRIKLALIEKISKGAGPREIREASDRLYGVVGRRSIRGITQRVLRKAKSKTTTLASLMRARGYSPRLILGLLWLKARTALNIGFSTDSRDGQDAEAIDIVIPTATKDFELLKSSVESLSLLRAKMGTIHIIGPQSTTLESFCAENGYEFVSEDSLLPGVKKSIRYTRDGMDLSGWILQQLLKLKSADIVKSKRYFVIDSDTVLTREHSFAKDGKSVFLESVEWHEPYMEAFERIFKMPVKNVTSSICHMMMFEKDMVLAMRGEMENLHGKPWVRAILDNLDYSKPSCFSEFETYANWMAIRHPRRITRIPFYNKSLPRSDFGRLKKSLSDHFPRAKSLSFHSYDVPRITKTNEK